MDGENQAGRGLISYGYDPADRLTEYAVSGGPVTDYTYYPDGSVATMSWSRIPGMFDFTYTLNGQYAQILMPNGQHRDFAFDDQGRLTQIANIHPTAGNLATYDYGYDLDHATGLPTMLGQRTTLTATVPSQGFSSSITKYYFDPRYQLNQTDYPNVSPFNGEVNSWIYDTIGNRLSETINGNPISYSYPINSELLSSVGTTTFSYNGNKSLSGKLTPPDLSTGFTWDVRNKLASTSFAGTVSTYSYDFRGRRFGKTVSGVAYTYLYAGQNLIADTTSGTTSEFVFAPGIDKPLAAYIAGSAYYYSVDGLGSVSLLNDAAGTVKDSYVYDVWGKTRSQTVNVPQPFVYTARETGENGLLYYRARYYSPEIGRFISEDPVRYADFSLYAYVGNDPVNFIDPSGMTGQEVVFACRIVGGLVEGGLSVESTFKERDIFFLSHPIVETGGAVQSGFTAWGLATGAGAGFISGTALPLLLSFGAGWQLGSAINHTYEELTGSNIGVDVYDYFDRLFNEDESKELITPNSSSESECDNQCNK